MNHLEAAAEEIAEKIIPVLEKNLKNKGFKDFELWYDYDSGPCFGGIISGAIKNQYRYGIILFSYKGITRTLADIGLTTNDNDITDIMPIVETALHADLSQILEPVIIHFRRNGIKLSYGSFNSRKEYFI